jgi:FtsH-binding integral membrane protein
VTDTSLPESNASEYPSDKRYPRPTLVRGFRWLVIRWWFLLLIGLIGLTVYLLLAFFTHVLQNNLLFLVQHWWAVLILIVVLLACGIAIYFSMRNSHLLFIRLGAR